MGQVTMKHLAERLGVSVTTVSNAYNKPDRLSAELREKILATGQAMGYCGPDAAGRVLRRGRADSIGVYAGTGMAHVFNTHFSTQVLAGVSEVLEERGISLCLLSVDADGGGAEHVQNAVIDALICLTDRGHAQPALEAAQMRGLPMIFTHLVPGFDHVSIDEGKAGRIAAEHLHGLGHRRIGVAANLRAVNTVLDGADAATLFRDFPMMFAAERMEALLDVLGPEGQVTVSIKPPSPALSHSQQSRRTTSGMLAARELLALTPRPTAIMAMSDEMAVGVLDELQTQGLRPGVDVSVIGYDGTLMAEQRELTTVAQPMVERGRLAAALALDPELTPRQQVLPVELVVRSSTGPVPTDA